MNQSIQTESVILDKVLLKELETRQLGSRQDYCAQGSYINASGEKVEWIAAFDGHGGNQAITAIRESDLTEIMKGNSPHIQLQSIIETKTNTKIFIGNGEAYMTGATMVFVKATFYKSYTEIEITNIGDSTGILYLNGKPIFVTKEHNYENGEEMIRLITEKRVNVESPIVKSSNAIESVGTDTICCKKGTYINFLTPEGESIELSPSQSLGHMGICGFKPTVTTFRVLPTDDFKVAIFSDGITDVMPVAGVGSETWIKYILNNTAKEIVNMAEKQWKQEWKICRNLDFTKLPISKFPKNGYDDCCCAIMEYKKIPLAALLPSLLDVSCNSGTELSVLSFINATLSDAVVAESEAKKDSDSNEDQDNLYN